jgi:hypothetical protein
MRKGFLIYEETRKYFPIYEEAVGHLWLCSCSILNFLKYEENLIFFFISVSSTSPGSEEAGNRWSDSPWSVGREAASGLGTADLSQPVLQRHKRLWLSSRLEKLKQILTNEEVGWNWKRQTFHIIHLTETTVLNNVHPPQYLKRGKNWLFIIDLFKSRDNYWRYLECRKWINSDVWTEYVACKLSIRLRHYSVIGKQLLFSNNRNRVRW